MLRQIRKGQRWLTAIFIAVIGAVFVFFIGLGGPLTGDGAPTAGAVVELDDERLDLIDFQRVRAQQEQSLRSTLGDQFDSRTASDFLDAQSMRILVDRVVLAHSAGDLGLVVSRDEIKNMLLRDPNLRNAEGKFDQKSFDDQIRWEYGSQRAFMSTVSRQLLQRKVVELLYNQAHVSDAEARSAVRFQLEQVRIAFVMLSGADLPEDAQPSEEVVATYLAENEASLRTRYAELSDRFATPERAKIHHILFRAEPGADAASRSANLERAEQALAEIRAGAGFVEVGTRLSSDAPGDIESRDLGFVLRGDLAAEIEEVAFTIEVGSASEPIESPRGLHLVVVEERQAESTRSFEEAGIELAREAAIEARAKSLAAELAAAIRAGESLEDAARARNLTLERTGLFGRRRDGYVPGLGPSRDLTAGAFALSLDNPSSPTVFEIGNRRVLVQLLEKTKPDETTIESSMPSVKERLLLQRRSETVQTWVDIAREGLIDTNRLRVDPTIPTGRS